MKTATITHNEQTFTINLDKAQELGLLVPDLPMRVGDVYKHPTNSADPLLFIEVIYSFSDPKTFTLLSMDRELDAYSVWHRELHTLEECKDYLVKKGMQFDRNILATEEMPKL